MSDAWQVHNHGPSEGRGTFCGERKLPDGRLAGWCLGDIADLSPAPTPHVCDSGFFDRSICPDPCGLMHSFCTVCGNRADTCVHDTAPTPTNEQQDVRETYVDVSFAVTGGRLTDDEQTALADAFETWCTAVGREPVTMSSHPAAAPHERATAYVVTAWQHTYWHEPHPAVPTDVFVRLPDGTGAHPLMATCATCGEVLIPAALAARPAPVVSGPLRVEWGVVTDDLGSTDVFPSLDQATAYADGKCPIVRIETWPLTVADAPAADDECCGWCGAKPTHAPEDCPRARDYQSQQIADAQTAADDEGARA